MLIDTPPWLDHNVSAQIETIPFCMQFVFIGIMVKLLPHSSWILGLFFELELLSLWGLQAPTSQNHASPLLLVPKSD